MRQPKPSAEKDQATFPPTTASIISHPFSEPMAVAAGSSVDITIRPQKSFQLERLHIESPTVIVLEIRAGLDLIFRSDPTCQSNTADLNSNIIGPRPFPVLCGMEVTLSVVALETTHIRGRLLGIPLPNMPRGAWCKRCGLSWNAPAVQGASIGSDGLSRKLCSPCWTLLDRT